MRPSPGAEQARPTRKNEPIAIDDDDDDSDGFEITGTASSQEPKAKSKQQASSSSSRPNPSQPKPEVQLESGSSTTEPLRSLIPDRAQLERERLERVRQREREAGIISDPSKIPDELNGRPPASMLDSRGATEAVLADREARSIIKSALRNLEVGSAAGGSGSTGNFNAPASSSGASAQRGPASSNAAPSSSSAGAAAGLYWWDAMAGKASSQNGTSTPSAAPNRKEVPTVAASSSVSKPTAAETGKNKRPRPNEESAKNSPAPAEQPVPKRRREEASTLSDSTYDANAVIQPSDRFWYGTVKHSFNRYAASSEPGATIASMVQPRGRVSASRSLSGSTSNVETRLEEVVASSYSYELQWLAKEVFDTGRTWSEGGTCPDVTFVAHVNDPDKKGVLPKVKDLPNWTIIVPIHPNAPPPRAGGSSGNAPARTGWFGVMHCKFIVLFYPKSHMRFILLSGNLVDSDWDRIENTAFIQDFRALSASDLADERIRARKSSASPFGIELVKLFDVLSLPKTHSARTRLTSYDLSQAVGSLVVSAPQRKSPSAWDQVNEWGVGRLGAVIRQPFPGGVGLQPARGGVDLEAQGSSLGELRLRWLQHFHLLASGIDPTAGSGRPSLPLPNAAAKANQKYGDILYPPNSVVSAFGASSKKGKGPVPGVVPPPSAVPDGARSSPRPSTRPARIQNPTDLPIKVCFPTAKWVKEVACEGPPGAGTFFAKKQKFSEGSFKHVFHQPVSKRGNVMMHAKTLVGLQPGYDFDDALVVSSSSTRSASSSATTAGKNGFSSSGSTLNAGNVASSGGDSKGKGKAKGKTATDSIMISDSSDSEGEISAVRKATTKDDVSTGGDNKKKGKGVAEQEEKEERRSPEAIGWVYAGSHNFTPSAWGTITDKNEIPSLSMSNWEVGIVLPLFDARDRKQGAGFDLHAHVSTLARNAVVYRRPLEPYAKDDVPWDQLAPENRALMGV
ncbi:hypothetical protein CF319_g1935 [Tilletia indica]|nr:hypothetical protein CF319_g1935 [Tilletia indica]